MWLHSVVFVVATALISLAQAQVPESALADFADVHHQDIRNRIATSLDAVGVDCGGRVPEDMLKYSSCFELPWPPDIARSSVDRVLLDEANARAVDPWMADGEPRYFYREFGAITKTHGALFRVLLFPEDPDPLGYYRRSSGVVLEQLYAPVEELFTPPPED